MERQAKLGPANPNLGWTIGDLLSQPPDCINYQLGTVEMDPMSAIWNHDVLDVATKLRELTLLFGSSRNGIVGGENN